MTDRPKFFDDLAGVAGGAFSALTGLRDEAESMVRARVDEAIRKLDLVKRDDLEAVQELAANARAGQQAAETRVAALEARMARLETGAGSPDVGGPDAGRQDAGGRGGASEVDPASMPPPPRPADTSGDGSEVAPGTMPPGSGAPGSSSHPTSVA